MELNKLTNTCSMYELGQVGRSSLTSLEDFKLNLKYLINKDIRHTEEKVIIHNTNFLWLVDYNERYILYKAGFRKIGGYEGRQGYVSILMKKL